MPELKLFKRRWHTATDALPALMALLCLFHIVWFIPYAVGAYSIEGTGLRYECNHATDLRVANYSLFALFGLAAVNELVLTVMGLRGGPFETRKRRFMNPLLYLEVALWVLLLGFTVYATVIVYSPAVNDACWSNNPCQYNPDVFPLACRDKSGGGIAQLSPACQSLVEAGPSFLDCWENWIVYGLNWVSDTVELINTWGLDRYADTLRELAVAANSSYADVPKHNLVEDPDLFAEFGEEASILTNCYIFRFLGCYLITRINRTDIYRDLRDGNLADTQYTCPFWDELDADPQAFCTSSDSPFNQSLLNNFAPCNLTTDAVYWQDTLNVTIELDETGNQDTNLALLAGTRDAESYNEFLRQNPDLFQSTNLALLRAINESTAIDLTTGVGRNLTTAADMPWFGCLSQTCQDQSRYADECTEWAQILSLPIPKSRKRFFEILVITSWSVLGITAAILLLCFNAFPDYDDVDSWEGTVRSLNRMCLCGGLAGSATVGGSDMSVSHEIAKSLNLLFGGVDMDPTDRLLGVYLVSERQHRRRQQDVLAALQDAGYLQEPRQLSRVGRVLSRLTPNRWRSGLVSSTAGGVAVNGAGLPGVPSSPQPQPSTTAVEDTVDAPQAVPLERRAGQAGAAAATGAAQAQSTTGAVVVQMGGSQLPASPFDMPTRSAQSQQHPAVGELRSPGSAHSGTGRRTMLYQHSMVRLRSKLNDKDSLKSLVKELAAVEEGGESSDKPSDSPPGSASTSEFAEPETVLEDPQQRGNGATGVRVAAGVLKARDTSASWQNSAIRVTAQFHPLLTPSGCTNTGRNLHPPISPRAAADIYAGKLDAVDNATLREAQRISRFAVAAYGLQGVIWAKGQRPGMCLANANRLVKCFKRPLGLENRFRKANFDAIIDITGVDPSDLLYVSYTNVAGGVLPYLIMLHRPSKSVVLSVRGTVSMEDLITDLLSNPVDVTDWVPDWVREEAKRRQASGDAGDASGDSLKAHIGIVSSATAILKDMEDRGLLREMLLSKLLRAATALGRDTDAVVAEFLEQHRGELPSVPPKQQASRAASSLESNPLAAAAAGHGLASMRNLSLGRKDEQEQAQFKRSEQRHLSHLQSMKEEREVDLPLERAQTIIRSKLQLQGWKVVVTGHSLGAAVACMLGMQLRERFGDLQCWAFNPPGGLLSWELAKIAETYCTSLVVGKDVISRLSFNTSKRVVDEMVVSLARCKRPKLKVLADVMLGRRKQPDTTPRTFCKFDEIAPEALELVERYYKASQLHMQTADCTEMYPPGRLIFVRPFKGKKKQQTVWDAVWIDAATLMSEGILVTPSMMAHHRMFVLAEAFESIFAGEVVTEAAAQEEQGEEDVMDIAHL